MKRKLILLLTLISIAIFTSSLFFPAFKCVEASNTFRFGYHVLLGGWLGLLVLDPRWFLNPMYFLLVIWNISPTSEYQSKQSLISILLISGSLSCLVIPAYGCSGGAATPGVSIELAIGGYLWVFATILVGVTAVYQSSPNPSLKRDWLPPAP